VTENRKILIEAIVVTTLVLVALFGVPVRRLDGSEDAPPVELQDKTAAVAIALANAGEVDRALWAEVWEKAAAAVEAEGTTDEAFVRNTTEVRAFTIAALEVAWNRLRGPDPTRYPGLGKAVEDYLADPAILGRDDVTIDAAYRARYGKACRALAYAGRKRG